MTTKTVARNSTEVFADVWEKLGHNGVTSYRCQLQVRQLLVGGLPGEPSVIRKWLEARLKLGDPRLEELLREVVEETDRPLSADDKLDLLMHSESAPKANMFARLPSGELAFGGRLLKAAFKEWANSSYPGNDWPGKERMPKAFRKGLQATLVERVFVVEHLIPLGVMEATRIEERIKHVMTPKGPRSSINRVEVIHRPKLSFTVRVHDDFLPREAWARIWERGEDIGIGADRARGDGQFDLIQFDPI
jgi:hypothetical protein